MLAMVLKALQSALEPMELEDGLPGPKLPMIPGHGIVGRIDVLGPGVDGLRLGEQVGIPWLGRTCGVCPFSQAHRENLCDYPLFTGFTCDGEFATAVIADAHYAFRRARPGKMPRWRLYCAPG